MTLREEALHMHRLHKGKLESKSKVESRIVAMSFCEPRS